jgi:hypothetical protein
MALLVLPLVCEGLQNALPRTIGRIRPLVTTRHHVYDSFGCTKSLKMSSEVNDEDYERNLKSPRDRCHPPSDEFRDNQNENWLTRTFKEVWKRPGELTKMPPFQVDDTSLLFYDVFLLVNLVLSISFWVVHRMDFQFIASAFSEGCLLSLVWIAAGLYSGAFLSSAVDGHYGSTDERGGPKAAALLGFQTFVNTVNLRLLLALVSAIIEHRPAGTAPGEEFLALEIGFGLVLMSVWRMGHSSFVPRI